MPLERFAGDEADHLSLPRWFAETLTRRRVILRVLIATYLGAIAAVLLIPPVYRSRASFVANSSATPKMPNAVGSGGALAGLASQLGVSSGADPSESPNFYLKLIESRELLTRLLQSRFQNPRSRSPRDSATLLDILRIRKSDPGRKLEVAIKQMAASITPNFDIKTNLVWIDVDQEWPQLSAAVANRTIDLVTAFNKEQRTSRARSKRIFLEGRVNLAKAQLDAAEARHRYFYDQNRAYRNSPALVFEEKRLQRDDDNAADLYTGLQRQLESALLDEVNDAALITVVDAAVPPHKAQWPRYGILLFASTLLGLILGALVAGSMVVFDDWARRNPEPARSLADALPGRRFRRRRRTAA